MNYDDVFQKSNLGREEIKSQSLGVLPREARTLLIMIDGKRTYKDYLNTLDGSKIFADFGGIAPLFELLLDLECIKIVGSGSIAPQPSLTSTKPVSSQESIAPPVGTEQQSTSEPFDNVTEKEFERTFNSKAPSKPVEAEKKSIGGFFKSKASASDYGTIKSDLATYIEKNAPSAEAWGYLLSLEQCEDKEQLLLLIQEIQKSASNELSRGMSDFSKRI